jgi:hypothetical protein
MNITNKQHVLRAPLVVYSQNQPFGPGVLPPGTSLRYVESFPEGFDRFLVFVNVERFPLPLEEVSPPELVDPLSATSGTSSEEGNLVIPIDELIKLLRSLGVKKTDLTQLVDSYE